MTPDSDEHLVRYLLGDLPDEEAERLDERSVTDEAFALRLRVIENDLIDTYARGEPFDASLEQFDRLHRASPHLSDKVRFAQALHALTAKGEPVRPSARIVPARRFAWWSLAAAAVFVIAAAGYLGVRTMRLGDELRQLDARQATVERRNAELQQELERTRAKPSLLPSPVSATFLLPPPRRSLGNEATTVSLPRGTEQATLRLQVESNDYATFWSALRDPVANRVVWRSADVAAEATGSDRLVTVTVPVSALQAQRYAVELSGVTGDGRVELIGHYLIRVVLQ